VTSDMKVRDPVEHVLLGLSAFGKDDVEGVCLVGTNLLVARVKLGGPVPTPDVVGRI
jgi:hypothetical protein